MYVHRCTARVLLLIHVCILYTVRAYAYCTVFYTRARRSVQVHDFVQHLCTVCSLYSKLYTVNCTAIDEHT